MGRSLFSHRFLKLKADGTESFVDSLDEWGPLE